MGVRRELMVAYRTTVTSVPLEHAYMCQREREKERGREKEREKERTSISFLYEWLNDKIGGNFPLRWWK